jgi:hypothetical protein
MTHEQCFVGHLRKQTRSQLYLTYKYENELDWKEFLRVQLIHFANVDQDQF